jgi:hypothetical protein
MSRRWGCLAGLLVLVAVPASADDEIEHAALARVRLTTEAALTSGCARIGAVKDDSVKDLKRKILRAGGNTGLLSFGVQDPETIYAEVFRCPGPAAAPPRIPPPPPGSPPPGPPSSGPPPPGPPPPPPPPPPAVPIR